MARGQVVADWGEPYRGVRGGPSPAPSGQGDALARLHEAGAGAAPDARLTSVRGGKGMFVIAQLLAWPAGRPLSHLPYFLTPALPEPGFPRH